MARNKLIIWLLLTICSADLSAQVNRYMVFFKDKTGSAYSVNKPEEFLSQRAIQRRIKQNIPIIEQDLPVKQDYLSTLSASGAAVFFTSKWMNGALIEVDAGTLSAISNLSFVKKAILVAPGPRLNKIPINWDGERNISSEGTKEISNALQNNMLGVDEMHNQGYTGEDMVIGVFDAGFIGMDKSQYFNHLFENDKILATYNFVENGTNIFKYDDHGTGVLSTISGYSENDFIGVAYNARVILCITEDYPTEYRIEEYNWLIAAEFADSAGVDIINTSLGYNVFDDPEMDYTFEELDGNTAIITQATDIAASKGILCVVSVGNEGGTFSSWKKLVAPADADTVLAVGAVDGSLMHVNFSSIGPSADGRIKPEVSALGIGTKLVNFTGELSSGSGTSYASPLIAGLAAGVWEAYPELNNFELIEIIKKGSSKYYDPDNELGYGVPDFRNIQSSVTAIDLVELDDHYKVYPNPVDTHRLFIESNNQEIRSLSVKMYDRSGKLVFQNQFKRDMQNPIEIDCSNMAKGVYFLELIDNTFRASIKILIP